MPTIRLKNATLDTEAWAVVCGMADGSPVEACLLMEQVFNAIGSTWRGYNVYSVEKA